MQPQLHPQLLLLLQPPPLPAPRSTRKPNRYDIDLSHLMLPSDEPLSVKVIEANRQLAYSIVEQALEDLLSDDDDVRRSAEQFCLSDSTDYREIRSLWLGWLGMDEEVLEKAAKKRLGWLSSAS